MTTKKTEHLIQKGYKAFGKGLVCRGFRYEVGKDFYHKGEIELCESGFHFCKSLKDVYIYYPYNDDTVVAEVESEGKVIDEDDGSKSVTNHLRITRILDKEEASNNTGNSNTGHSNTGYSNTGNWNTGNRNTGHSNTGNSNTGYSNTGDYNTGYSNTGDRNTGGRNTGDYNTGDYNTGYSNTGDRNTGDWNTGGRNTGHSNTGNRNTGDWNTSNYNNGSFNTKEVKEIMVFNRMCKKEKWDNAVKPSCLYFGVNKWIPFEEMTDSEKSQYGTSAYTGGYMKKLDYKEAFTESMKNASKEDIELVKKLPNFDKKVFYEISGFMIE